MPFDSQYMLDIDDGKLVSSPAELSAMFAAARASGKPIVIHFHGGLNSRSTAIDAATFAIPFYKAADAYPIFPIWRTGLFETLGDIWWKIATESLFHILVDRVSGWTHAHIESVLDPARGGKEVRSLPRVTIPVMKDSAMRGGDFSVEFLQGLDVSSLHGMDIELTGMEEKALESEIRKDTELKLEIDSVIQSVAPAPPEGSRDLDGSAPQPPTPSVADPAVLKELAAEADVRSLGVSAAVKIVKIIARVLQRFKQGRDHGFHATVVEEVLRAFYLGPVGNMVWADMKSDAHRSFQKVDSAGNLLLAELALVPENQRVLLVGHSAGSIFISELFAKAGESLRKVEVIFLAPAVRCKLFADGVLTNADRVLNFRMFSMSDTNESRDTLIRNVPHIGDLPWFYPRSLLYLISGILEEDSGDDDVLGLERIHIDTWWNNADPSVTRALDFMKQSPGRVAWSVNDGTDKKMKTNSLSHGGFGTPNPDNTTMQSVANILREGW